MIVITGATGHVGSEVTRQLLAQGVRPRVLVRNPAKAEAMLGREVEIVQGDYEKPDTLDAGFQGADKVFMAVPSRVRHLEMESNVVDAARRAGVMHLVKLSVIGATPFTTIGFLRTHYLSEKHIEELEIPFTFLRPNLFMQNLIGDAETIAQEGKLYTAMKNGRVGMIDTRDVAAVGVKALTEDGHDCRAYTLTGPEAISYSEVAEKLSAATGKKVEYVDIPPEVERQHMLDAGLPEQVVETYMTYMWFNSQNYGSIVTHAVERITGRRAITFDQFARNYAEAFTRAKAA